MSLQQVNPTDIRLPDWDIRYLRSPEWAGAFAEDIQKHGITHPVLIYKPADFTETGKYNLIDGRTRTFIAQTMNLATIPALIINKPEEDVEGMSLRLNMWQQTLDPLSLAMAANKAVTKYGWDYDSAAASIGVSTVHYHRLLKLWMLPEEEKEKIAQGKRPAFTKGPVSSPPKTRVRGKRKTGSSAMRCSVCGQWPEQDNRKWFLLCAHHTEEIAAIKKAVKAPSAGLVYNT